MHNTRTLKQTQLKLIQPRFILLFTPVLFPTVKYQDVFSEKGLLLIFFLNLITCNQPTHQFKKVENDHKQGQTGKFTNVQCTHTSTQLSCKVI